MAVMINCMTCKKTTEAELDKQKNEVYCSQCGSQDPNASHFTKVQLKATGQIKKPVRGAYSVRCNKCKQEALPSLNAQNDLICSWCNNTHTNISVPFAILIKEAIAKGNQDL